MQLGDLNYYLIRWLGCRIITFCHVENDRVYGIGVSVGVWPGAGYDRPWGKPFFRCTLLKFDPGDDET